MSQKVVSGTAIWSADKSAQHHDSHKPEYRCHCNQRHPYMYAKGKHKCQVKEAFAGKKSGLAVGPCKT